MLSLLLPLNQSELKFLDILYEKGKIDSSLLTDDINMRKTIEEHPLMLWKAKIASE